MTLLNGRDLTLADLWSLAVEGKKGALDPQAKPGMQASRDLVEKLAGEARAIYGINTGFGPLSGERVDAADLEKHQVHLLHHLSVGQGELYSDVETKAVMAARANALARGYSGIRIEVVELLLEAMNRGVLPEIPQEGSVGASGDLVPLAHMSRLLIGLGHARAGNERLLATDALAAQGLAPVTLQAKEGLALVNGTSVMTGLAGLSAVESESILRWMEFFTSCLIQIMNAAPEILCGQIHKARGHRGQYASAERMATHLKTHVGYAREIDEHHWGTRPQPLAPGVEIQDPYSIRCAPQILGAFQDALGHVQAVTERELNASTDNPLFFPETETVIHGGNFYGQQIAMTSDYLRLGLVKLALLSERQTERLMNWRYSTGLPPMLAGGDPGLNSGLAGAQLLATSLAAEARTLSAPASVQSIPTNANNQDVVSMGTTAARMTRRVLPLVWKILAVEALALVQAADLRGQEFELGSDFQRFREMVREVSPGLEKDRPLYEEIGQITALLQSKDAREAFFQP